MKTSVTRRQFLQGYIDSDQPIPIELLLEAGFPASSAFPPYWYGSAPGARLAFELGYKPSFSRKLMHIEFLKMTELEKVNYKARIEIEKARYADRNRAIRDHIAAYVSKHVTEDCSEAVARDIESESSSAGDAEPA